MVGADAKQLSSLKNLMVKKQNLYEWEHGEAGFGTVGQQNTISPMHNVRLPLADNRLQVNCTLRGA